MGLMAVTSGPRKPPRTVIVQQWMESQDKAELSERAWEATMAACRGM